MLSSVEREEQGNVFGFWGTFFWGVITFIVFNIGQMIPLISYMVYQGLELTEASFDQFFANVEKDSFLLFLSAMGGMVFAVPFVLGIAKLKKGSIFKEYFSLNGFTTKTLGFSILVFILLYIAIGLFINTMGAKEIPDFMMNLEYPSLWTKIALLVAVVVAAPIVEEVIFRGFLLKGFSQTFMGVHGAVFVSSALWAVIHVQYEMVYLIAIFLIGLVFGYARIMSNSLYIPMIMHALMNLWSMLGLFYEKGVI